MELLFEIILLGVFAVLLVPTSVFAIECPRWRAQVLAWLCGARYFFDGTQTQPKVPEYGIFPNVRWSLSFIIDGRNNAYNESEEPTEPIEFLPAAKLNCCHETVTGLLDEALLLEWLESLMDFEYLFDHLTDWEIPEMLRKFYQF